jgi:spore maturation protein CgeB
MRILIVGYYLHSWHEAAFERAFSELGHDVHRFAFRPYLERGWSRPQNRFLFGPLVWRINRDFFEEAKALRPDIILFYRSLLLKPQTVAQVRADLTETTLISYHNDNMFGALKSKAYWRFFRQSLPLYHLNLVYRHSDLKNYPLVGASNVRVLRSHYLPWLHRPLTNETKDIDFGLYGHSERDRRLKDVSFLMQSVKGRYAIRGALWKEFGRHEPWALMETSEVQNEEYVRFINRTKIVLAFLSTLNADTYTRRCFEIPACGSFMLCQRTEDLLSLFCEDQEAVFFGSADELVTKARYYLKHDSERLRIAAAGFRRCTSSGYDIYSRTKEILSHIEAIR